MSIKIKINWDNGNAVSESVRIYRADTAFTSASLPPILDEIFGDIYEYEDLTVTEGNTYFYMLSATLDSQEKFTACYEVDAALSPTDPSFSTVTMLMQFNGASPLIDSKTGILWTLYGDAFINTSDKMFDDGGALQVSDSASSYARSPTLNNIYAPNVAGKELTVEFFFKKTSSIGNAGALSLQDASNLNTRCAFFMRSGSTNFNCAVYTPQSNTFTFIDAPSGVNLNEWAHFAYVEYLGVAKLYINGVQKGAYGATPMEFWENTVATIGQNGLGGESYGGLIDGVRISKTARYKSEFTPPIAPFPTQ